MKTTRILALASVLTACGGGGGQTPPPQPASIVVNVDPSRLWYHTSQDVTLVAGITDAQGMSVDGAQVIWTVDPSDGASPGASGSDPLRTRYTLGGPGTVVFTGCVVPPDPMTDGAVPEPTLCDSVALRIDDGMPSLEVSSPMPGDELEGGDGITVQGSVADRSTVRVYVNGQGADVDDRGHFQATLPAQFGINHITVDASDGLTDPSVVEMDVLWAQSYTAGVDADGHPSLTLPHDGLALRLGQPFFDDGVPLDTTATPVTTRDLADLIELIIDNVDVSGLVPNPVVDTPPTFTLRISDLTLGAPHAELSLTDGGADLFIRIGDIDMNTSGALIVDGTSLPLNGSIHASAFAHAHLTIRKDSSLAPLQVSMGDPTVGIENLTGTFESDETTAVFQLASGPLRAALENALSDAMRGTVSSIPTVLGDALGSIDTALSGQSFMLDSAPFPPVTVQIDGGIDTLSTVYRREMLALLRTTVGTDAMSVHPESRGVARLDTSAMGSEFFREGSLTLGVRLALLQGLLHALWDSGLLDVDATPLLPASVSGLVSEARIVGKLPPVLRPARADETDDLVLSVGQLELELTFMGEPARFAVSLDAGVNVNLADNHIALDITDSPTIHVWTLEAAANPHLLSADTIASLLRDMLWPSLAGSVASGVGFDLPIPAIGDLGGLAPGLAGLTLTLSETGSPRIRQGVLILEAELTGSVP